MSLGCLVKLPNEKIWGVGQGLLFHNYPDISSTVIVIPTNQLEDLTIDHIAPLSKGGTDDLDNLRFLCRSHNSKKGDR